MSNRTGVIVLSRKYADMDGVDECLTFSENNTFAELRERLVVRYAYGEKRFECLLKDVPDKDLPGLLTHGWGFQFDDLGSGAISMEYALRNAYKNNKQ